MPLTIVDDDVVGQFSTTVSKTISVQSGDLLVVHHHSEGELADMLTPTPGSWVLQESGGLSSGRGKGKSWTQAVGSTDSTYTVKCRNTNNRLHGFAYWLLRDTHGATPVTDSNLFSEADDDDFNLPALTAPSLPSFALYSILAVGSTTHDVQSSTVERDDRYSFFGYGSIDAYHRYQQSAGALPTIGVEADEDEDHVVLATMVQGEAGLAAAPLRLEEVETLSAVGPAHALFPDVLIELETFSDVTLLKGQAVDVLDEIETLAAAGVIQDGNRIVWADRLTEVESLAAVQVHKTRKVPAARDADRGFTKEFRIVAQRWTGEILDLDVQMTGLEVTEAILGPGSITGMITPEQAQYTVDGYPIFEQWGTLLTAEYRESGEVLCSAILTDITTRDEDLQLTADGFSAYSDGLPHLGEYSRVQVDACDAYREMWAETQRWPGRTIGMGVTVSNHMSGVLLGEPAFQEPVLDENGLQRRNEDGTLQFREVEAKPYELSKRALTDMGQEMLKLAKGVPFDYEERAWWNEDSTDFHRHIEIAIPRFGRFRPELAFVLGENIEEYPDLIEDPAGFADFGVAVGKGEGDKGVYTTHSVRNENRLSRVHTLTDKTVGDSSQLQRLLADDLRSMRQPREIRRIVVDRWHSHAPDGSYRKGDDILVQGDFSWWGRIAIKHRIVSITRRAGEDTVELDLRRSDSWSYRRDPGLA